LMIRMRVGQRVCAHPTAAQLAQDPAPRVARAGVDQHVAHQVDVDRVRGKSAELIEAFGKLLHARILRGSARPGGTGPKRTGRARRSGRWEAGWWRPGATPGSCRPGSRTS